MTTIDSSGPNVQREHSPMAELIVKGAIALVTAAFFIGAYLQFDVPFWLALIAALCVYITLLMLHALFRRSERVDVLVKEVTLLEVELARLKGGGPRMGRPAPPQRPGAPGEMSPVPSSRGGTPPRSGSPAAARVEHRSAGSPALSAAAVPRHSSEQPNRPGLPHWPGTSLAPDPMHDYWAFRPSEQTLREAPPGSRDDVPQPSFPQEDDLEAVQAMIEKLADEVGITEGLSKKGTPPTEQEKESALKASVDALQSTADTMRAAAAKAPPSAPRKHGAGPLPPPISPVHARLSTLAGAIAAGRMDVLLKRIVGLADQRTQHYEVLARLSDEKGAVLATTANDAELARTGLLPMLDSARLKRAAQVARSFAQTGHKHLIFCAAAGESLTSDHFLDEFAVVYREREELADQIVLTFTQADVRAFGGGEWRTLADMRDVGFRFGLDAVTDFELEFKVLKETGFAYAKLDADIFLKGLPGSNGPVSAKDICRHLAEFGLTAIADHVDDEPARARISEFGVRLGQGQLFGGAQPVKPENLAGAGIAAA